MNMNGMLGRLFLACLLSASVFALDPSRNLTQYAHTAWRVRDGYLSTSPLAIAQTKDGELWIGGEGGLLRFDGVQFSPWTPPEGQALPDARIYGLIGASDGSLWIGTGSGLARWKNDQLVVYANAGRFSSLLEDHQGTIWAGHTRAQGVVPPLCQFVGNEFKCFAFSDRPGMSWVGALKEDHNGDLWIATAGAVCRQRRMGKTKCYVIPTSNPLQTSLGIQCMAIDSDDGIWLDGGITGIWHLQSGQWKHYHEFPQLKLELGSSLVDREGGLWFGDLNHGLIRHVEGRVERFDRTDGLSGETVTAMLEDREGSVWVATSAGLDRFRDVKVATITHREGLPLSGAESVVASRDGSFWIAGTSELIHTKIDRPGSYKLVRGLPENGDFGAIFEDSHGRLWLGVGRALAWRENGQFHKVPSLKLHQIGERVRAFSEDIQGDIWAATTDPEFPLVRIRDGRVLEHFTLQQLGDEICAMAADPKGGMWLSRAVTPGPILAHDGTFEMRAEKFPGSAGNMFFDSHGLWASTRKGVVSYDNGILNMLSTKNGLPCDDLGAAIKDDSGALWLKGTCGLIQIPASELELWLKDPGRRVQIRYLDAFDGAQAGTSSFVHATKTSDGRIWFALEGLGVQVVDPKRLQDNPIPPTVAVTKLVADHRPYDSNSELRLPALTRDLEIDYTAYSLMIPEKVQFRYRLKGVDKSWQDVGSRRQAYFTNLKPGSYRFDLLASNNDGLWNEQGASLDFDIAPAIYQTNGFLFLCGVTGFGFLYLLYKLRVRHLARQFEIRMKERVWERTRIARDLHDTLLQSFQGVLLKLHALTYMLGDRPEAQKTLGSVMEQARQAITEGRDAVQGLRSSTLVTTDLARSISMFGDELTTQHSGNHVPDFRVHVEGTPLDLAPMLRDDIYRIAGEAVRNAFWHARAAKIEVEIRYDPRQLRLRIRDDGTGIDPKVLESGARAGHYGLPGLQEHAKLVGGKLTVWSKPGSGTEIELIVPASIAYASKQSR
jgi:signal transduction histidine kinase/ligand-binding sensor domain-containing protein